MLDIISAVNESVEATRCEGSGNCQNGAMCLTHDLWHELSEHIESYLADVTLGKLLERQNVQTVALRQHATALHAAEL